MGSSPLSRGIHRLPPQRLRHPRIIPALAGNTRLCRDTRHHRRDHPRSRGEYKPTGCDRQPFAGSSPLSRGIPLQLHQALANTRIIPALAGNTMAFLATPETRTDHPRSRGEYQGPQPQAVPGDGSSPLSRGILRRTLLSGRRRRIIPALAGNTFMLVTQYIGGGDHPRSRGEYLVSTHTRELMAWIIPALAGNTAHTGVVLSDPRDHPRSRGEYHMTALTLSALGGSSPLSRGIRCYGCGDG